jgi:hypothetical protein
MKKILFFLILLTAASGYITAQDRMVARGAEPGELYISGFWYGIYWGGPPYYDTLRSVLYRLTENGKNLTIQYDADCFANEYNPPGSTMIPSYILADATPGTLYTKNTYDKNNYSHTSLWVS